MENFEVTLLLILLVVGGYCLISKRLSDTIITLPIIFTALGYLVYQSVSNLADAETLKGVARLLGEITLILVLFADASHVRFRKLSKSYQLPLRMLVLGMPMTIALGTVVVFWLSPEAGWAVALLTAAILTPTDAALGQSVISSMEVPQRLSQTINVESGLNDGLALPVVLVGAILAGSDTMMAQGQVDQSNIAMFTILQLTLGLLAGIAVGWLAARALDWAQNRDWVNVTSQGILFLATAFVAFLCAELIGGNGFIAAFVAGAVFGNTYRHDIHFISEFMEGQGQLLTMAAFFVFGAVLLPAGIAHMSIQALIVAMLFLTVVRMVPIWLSLAGSGLGNREKLFLGWFGPRGLASMLFALIVVDEFDIPQEEELLACVVMTVFISIVLHGISSTPLAKKIGRM